MTSVPPAPSPVKLKSYMFPKMIRFELNKMNNRESIEENDEKSPEQSHNSKSSTFRMIIEKRGSIFGES